MILVSIDPGLRGCGCAAWRDGELIRAGYVDGQSDPDERALGTIVADTVSWIEVFIGELRKEAEDIASRPNGVVPRCYAPGWAEMQLVIECPQTYVGRAGRGDANDLIAITLVAGAILGRLEAPAHLVRPAEWKGQTPKKTKHDTNPIELRCRGKLSAMELARVVLPKRKGLAHNTWDAVGIGLWHLER